MSYILNNEVQLITILFENDPDKVSEVNQTLSTWKRNNMIHSYNLLVISNKMKDLSIPACHLFNNKQWKHEQSHLSTISVSKNAILINLKGKNTLKPLILKQFKSTINLDLTNKTSFHINLDSRAESWEDKLNFVKNILEKTEVE